MHPKEAKQVIVVRKDLKMRKGKIAAQAAHASMKVFFDRKSPLALALGFLWIPLTKPMFEWVSNSFAKVVVYVESEQELLRLQESAKEHGILCALICDSGRTEFHGVPTYTALAVGPDYSEKVNLVTGNLPLL
jgi:PTH2 family peptidyl-tRNA hydrolase